MVYRNAWNCRKCPESNGERGCPAWVEYAERNPAGDERLAKECLFQALPKFLVHTMAAANQAAATMDGHRNEIVAAMGGASRAYLRGRTAGMAAVDEAAFDALPLPETGR